MEQPAYSQFNVPSNGYLSATNEFMNSNSLVAKVAFLLLALIVFFILLRMGVSLLGYFLGPSNSPLLVDGMVDAKQLIVIPQDPSLNGAITIGRSNNEDEGIEFTWSVWIYIDDMTYNQGKYRCVFYKGNDYAPDANSVGLNFPNNAPGLYLAPDTNRLVIMMNTFNVINEEIDVDEMPLNKWVNVIIRCQNSTLDIYINGTIVKSHELHGVPKQNYGEVYIAPNGGFSGYISRLQYFDRAVSASQLQKITQKGPNNKMIGTNGITLTDPNYLSSSWYFGQ